MAEEDSLACQITFLSNKERVVFKINMKYIEYKMSYLLLCGDVIWHASDSSLVKEPQG